MDIKLYLLGNTIDNEGQIMSCSNYKLECFKNSLFPAGLFLQHIVVKCISATILCISSIKDQMYICHYMHVVLVLLLQTHLSLVRSQIGRRLYEIHYVSRISMYLSWKGAKLRRHFLLWIFYGNYETFT